MEKEIGINDDNDTQISDLIDSEEVLHNSDKSRSQEEHTSEQSIDVDENVIEKLVTEELNNGLVEDRSRSDSKSQKGVEAEANLEAEAEAVAEIKEIEKGGNDNDNEVEIGENEEDEEDDEEDSELNEEESEENEDEEEEEEEEEEPPKLKYSRLLGLPPAFFSRDPVSCCLIHDSFLAFATHSGVLHLSKPDMTPLRTFRAHKASILSITTNGEYFATASMDGSVVIGSIKDESDITKFDFKRPVHCVALDKNYKSTKWFVSGGMAGQVIVSQKNWMNSRSDIIIDQGQGPIVGIHYIGEVLMWANDKGITIYNTSTKSTILTIARPDNAPRADLYWPRFHTVDTDRVIIGWCDYIYSIRVDIIAPGSNSVLSSNKSFLSSAASSFRAPVERKAEIESTLHIDSLIAGVASFSNDLLLLLTYTVPEVETDNFTKPKAPPPEIRLVNASDGEEIADDQVVLKDHEYLGLNDYHLGKLMGESISPPKYFLVSARDAVIAEEFNIHDRLNWYLEKKKFKEAWLMSEHIISEHRRVLIGLQEIDQLISQEKWLEAGKLLREILQISYLPPIESDIELTDHQLFIVEKWEEYVNKFVENNKISEITDVIPTDLKLKINHELYETILIYHLEYNKPKYLELIELWSSKLYNIKHIEQLLEEKIELENDPKLRQILSNLYIESNEPHLAVPHLIELKNEELFIIFTKYHLLSSFLDELPEIISMNISKEELLNDKEEKLEEMSNKLSPIINMLIHNIYETSPKKIIEILKKVKFDVVLYLYLEKLYQISNIDSKILEDEEDLMIELLSKFNTKKLLYFLINHSNYNIDKAIKLFDKRNKFIKELIYLLGKIGRNIEALKLIIEEIEDPDEAISFVKNKIRTNSNNNENNKFLLKFLIDNSIQKPVFITALIEKAQDLINPIDLIAKIPESVIIDNLKINLINIILNNDLNLLLNDNILKIINNETVSNANMFNKLNERGYLIDNEKLIEKIEELNLKYPNGAGAIIKPMVNIQDHEKIHNSLSTLQNDDFKELINKMDSNGGEIISEVELLGESKLLKNKSGSKKDLSMVLRHLAYIQHTLKTLRGY